MRRQGPRIRANTGGKRRRVVVIAVAMLLGLALDYVGFNAVKMLFWSAVLNGVLVPPLIVLVVLLTSNAEVMGTRVSSRLLRALGWAPRSAPTHSEKVLSPISPLG